MISTDVAKAIVSPVGGRIKLGAMDREIAPSLMRGSKSGCRIISIKVVLLIAFLGVTDVSTAGSGFSDQGNALSKALSEHLTKKKVCRDYQNCHQLLQMHGEDGGGRIYFSMYGQADAALSSMVAGFLVANGLEITGGMPITLFVFKGPKTQYWGFLAMIRKSQESIKLEINK